MSHRMSLFRELLFALSVASPVAVYGVESSTLQWNRAGTSAAGISISSEAATDTAGWKSNNEGQNVEIRFKKRETLLFTDQPPAETKQQNLLQSRDERPGATIAAAVNVTPSAMAPSVPLLEDATTTVVPGDAAAIYAETHTSSSTLSSASPPTSALILPPATTTVPIALAGGSKAAPSAPAPAAAAPAQTVIIPAPQPVPVITAPQPIAPQVIAVPQTAPVPIAAAPQIVVPAAATAPPAMTVAPPAAAVTATAPAAQTAPASVATPAPAAANQNQPAEHIQQSSAPRTDEHVQLVARMFQDDPIGDMPPTPEVDEPLPQQNGSQTRRNNNRRNDRDEDQELTDDYMGECYGDTCCPPPPPPLFWVAGVEATFLNPDLNSDGVTFQFEEISEERSDWVSSQSSEIDSIYLAPRIWIGVQGCKWGANFRYWHMNASEGYFDPSIGSTGEWDAYDCGVPDLGFISCSRFEAYTIDLEVTRRFCLNDCQMLFSAGLRHAEIEHGESIIGTALATDATFTGFAAADRYTRGTGVVFGLYGRKPLFPCSCVHWFYNVRWSALWGPTETRVETAANMFSQSGSAGSINGASTCVDDNLFIGEIQLGLEWNYALRCLPANAFFRAAVEYQRWDGGIGYSESGSFAGIEVNNEFTSVASTFASAAAPELDLVGITLGTGLTW